MACSDFDISVKNLPALRIRCYLQMTDGLRVGCAGDEKDRLLGCEPFIGLAARTVGQN